jgi:hypothetical protein
MSDERIPVGWHADGTPAYLPDDLFERHDSGPWIYPLEPTGRRAGKSYRADQVAQLITDDEAARAFLKARGVVVPVTVRVIHYRQSDCYRVVTLNADGNEITLIGIYTEGGEDGYWRAEQAADLAAFEQLLPISRVDLP